MKTMKTNEAIHTPGPWTVQRTISGAKEAVEITGHNSEGEAKYSVFVESPAYVLAAVSGTGESECLANARLIASAPDLLRQRDELRKAMSDIADCAEHPEQVWGADPIAVYARIRSVARAALASAESVVKS